MRPDSATMVFKPTWMWAWNFPCSSQLESHTSTNLLLDQNTHTLRCSSPRPNESWAAILGSICISTTQSVWNREHGQIGRGKSARQWLQNADVHVCFVWMIMGWLWIRCDAWFESRISYCGIVGLDRKIWILWFHWKLMYWKFEKNQRICVPVHTKFSTSNELRDWLFSEKTVLFATSST